MLTEHKVTSTSYERTVDGVNEYQIHFLQSLKEVNAVYEHVHLIRYYDQ